MFSVVRWLSGWRYLRLGAVLILGSMLLAGISSLSDSDGPGGHALKRGAQARVMRAIDWDTLLVRSDGRFERVRILGVDTPETVKPGSAVQVCGSSASAMAKVWARRHPRVRLVADRAAPDRDRYGRLLRYVDPRDGSPDLSSVQTSAGLARTNDYGQHLDRLDDLRAAQQQAKRAGCGLWGTGCT